MNEGYTLYVLNKNGRRLDQRNYRTKKEAQTAYNAIARQYRLGKLAPDVVEVCLYEGEDLEMLATTETRDPLDILRDQP